MKLSLFDLHCDTAYEMRRQGQGLEKNSLAVSLQKAGCFERYLQVMAHWTDSALDDEEGWKAFYSVWNNLQSDPAVQKGKAGISTVCPPPDHRPTLLLAVEDARILGGRLERVDELFRLGIRILTPLWKGETCIGGSHDTASGLTEFGKEALLRASKLGMILDLSHASERSSWEILEIAEKANRPVIASHSNAYDLCPVSRNLKKEQIQAVIDHDGIIGINLHCPFLSLDGKATADHVTEQISYFLELGAADHLALGCDMDGCQLPTDLSDLSRLPLLAEKLLAANYPESLIQKIFYQNAYSFAQKYLREEIDTSAQSL